MSNPHVKNEEFTVALDELSKALASMSNFCLVAADDDAATASEALIRLCEGIILAGMTIKWLTEDSPPVEDEA
jgi:hypothetical protein